MRLEGGRPAGVVGGKIYEESSAPNQEWLGDVYAAMQRYGDAVNCYIAVITMLENIFGSDYARIEAVKIKMDQMRQ